MLANTFSRNLLAIKWLLLEHFFKGLFSEKIKWSIDTFRDKMIEQNTDRKFHKDACAREYDDRCVFIRVCQIVADSNSSFVRTTSYNAALLEYYKECRHMAERSADESVFFDLLLSPNR